MTDSKTRMFNYAALSGQLDRLKYVHEYGCPWNEEV